MKLPDKIFVGYVLFFRSQNKEHRCREKEYYGIHCRYNSINNIYQVGVDQHFFLKRKTCADIAQFACI